MESLTAIDRDGAVALATLCEVLSAYTTVCEGSRRERGPHAGDERLPWRGPIPGAAMECEPLPEASQPPAPSARQPVAAVPVKPATAVRRRRRSCRCGKCSSCKDNARWERIFQEKFADPEYYRQPLQIRYASPLSRP